MIRLALSSDFETSTSYVLMDSWFTLPPLIQAITEQGLNVIGMVKNTKQRYTAGGQVVLLKQLYRLAKPL